MNLLRLLIIATAAVFTGLHADALISDSPSDLLATTLFGVLASSAAGLLLCAQRP